MIITYIITFSFFLIDFDLSDFPVNVSCISILIFDAAKWFFSQESRKKYNLIFEIALLGRKVRTPSRFG